jgi:hypothetical protein
VDGGVRAAQSPGFSLGVDDGPPWHTDPVRRMIHPGSPSDFRGARPGGPGSLDARDDHGLIARTVAPPSRSTDTVLGTSPSCTIFVHEGATGHDDEAFTMNTDNFYQVFCGLLANTASATLLASILTLQERAQEMPYVDTERGTFLIHGNYCGPGNRSPRPPIDALDVACMHHDICSPPRGQVATCACNDRLHREAEAVSLDPNQPESLRDTAGLVADTATALPCR